MMLQAHTNTCVAKTFLTVSLTLKLSTCEQDINGHAKLNVMAKINNNYGDL